MGATGTFTNVIDKSDATDNKITIGNSYTKPSATLPAGITLAGTNTTAAVGVRYGKAVALTIDGNWGAATATNNGSLRWIEGGTINVKPKRVFCGLDKFWRRRAARRLRRLQAMRRPMIYLPICMSRAI